MRKMILTSCGIIDEKIKKELKKIITKPIQDCTMLYIPIAADVETGDKSWIQEEMNHILALGIQKEKITEYRLDKEINIREYNIVYVLGGNTFYLLKKIRESKFDQKIKQAIEEGTIYIGSSAGSIIMGNTIALARDENLYVNDLTGLKQIDGIIIPHANKRQEWIAIQKSKYPDKIYAIQDNHAILVLGEEIKEI